MEKIFTISDAGSVKIGCAGFSVLLPNGYGDGDTEVIILTQEEEVPSVATFFTSINGTFFLYDYDCGGAAVREISGRYGVFYRGGHRRGRVYFKKWN